MPTRAAGPGWCERGKLPTDPGCRNAANRPDDSSVESSAALHVVHPDGDQLLGAMPSPRAATCLAALERVRRTGRPLRVTRFGKPVADIVPPAATTAAKGWLGDLAETLELHDDLIAPASPGSDGDVLR